MRLLLKGFTLIGAIVTFLATLAIFWAVAGYFLNPPHELAPVTRYVLRIGLFILAGLAGVEAALMAVLANLETQLRPGRRVFAGVCLAIALLALLLVPFLA